MRWLWCGALLAACGTFEPPPAAPAAPPPATGPAPASPPTEWTFQSVESCGARCVQEHWQLDGRALSLERRPQRLRGPGGPWMRSWPYIYGVLGACLGDPLSREPVAERRLVQQDGELWWWLQLSTTERCGLGGELALHTRRNQGRLEALQVEGLPWSAGGRERAKESLRLWLIEEARSPDSTLSDEERAWLELQLQ